MKSLLALRIVAIMQALIYVAMAIGCGQIWNAAGWFIRCEWVISTLFCGLCLGVALMQMLAAREMKAVREVDHLLKKGGAR